MAGCHRMSYIHLCAVIGGVQSLFRVLMTRYVFTVEEIKSAMEDAYSIADILRALNLAPTNMHARRHLEKFFLDNDLTSVNVSGSEGYLTATTVL